MSEITKKHKMKYKFFKFISLALILGPVFYAFFYAFINGDVKEKVALSFSGIVAIIFVVLNVLFKYRIRSTIWILLLGIHFVISNMTALLLALAITTILDEFVFSPLSKVYLEKYKINREIDKRG